MTPDEAIEVYNQWTQDDDFDLLPEALGVLVEEVMRLRKGLIYIADYETDYPQSYADKLLEGP